MASPPDFRRLQRRDSLPKSQRSASLTRPRLLRGAATEPLITVSNASRNALANSQTSRRATELLSQVAVVSGSSSLSLSPVMGLGSIIRPSSPLPVRTASSKGVDHRPGGELSSPPSSPGSFDELHLQSYTERYVSFPSFDMYEAGQQEGDKDADMKAP